MRNNLYNGVILSVIFCLGLLTSCYAAGNNTKKKNTSSKPNIIYILADDLGYGDLGFTGQKQFDTPNIDKLASQGMRFSEHYCGSAVCAPSRATLMTGLHTGHASIRGNKEHKPEGQFPMSCDKTIADILKDAGYTTGAFGKWGLGYINSDGDANKSGFDEFYGYNCQKMAHKYYPTHLWHNDKKIILEGNTLEDTVVYAQDLIQEEALKFIDTNKDDPFFLYIPYILPHAELIVPQDSILEKFDGKFDETPYVNKSGDYGNPDVRLEKYCSQEKPRATFAAMVYRLDYYVGQVMNKVKELGLDENTIIIFASDNGPHAAGGADPNFFNSNGEYRGIKRDLYDGGVRTAFIVKWDGTITQNSTSNHLSAFWDMMPTIADLVNQPCPDNTDGISFLPTLLGNTNKQKQHEYLYWEFHERGGSQAIRKGPWKAIKLKVSKNSNPSIELYNLSVDPSEENDVAMMHPEIVKDMKRIFGEARNTNKAFPLLPVERKKK